MSLMTDNDKIVRFLWKSGITVETQDHKLINVIDYARKVLVERGEIEWQPQDEDE